MRFYLVYEIKNGSDFRFLKGVYLEREDAENVKAPKSSHAEIIDGHYKMVPDIYNYEVVETDIDNPTFDVYIDYVGRIGIRISGLTYEKAIELFERYSETDWVELQIPKCCSINILLRKEIYMKYVVLSRSKEDGSICYCFGCFRKKRNANKALNEVLSGSYDDQEYLVEEVDPLGSYANAECEDEEN